MLEIHRLFTCLLLALAVCAGNGNVARGDDAATLKFMMDEVSQLVFAKKYPEAELAAKKLVDFSDRAFRDDAGVGFFVASQVSMVYTLQDRYVEAEPFLNRGLVLSERLDNIGAETLAQVVSSLNLFAMAYATQERHSEAYRLRKRSVQIVESVRGPSHPDLMQPLLFVGMAASSDRHYREAEYFFRRAVSVGDSAGGQTNPFQVMALAFLATNLMDQNRLADAEAFAKRAVAAGEQGGFAASQLPGSLGTLASILEREGRFADAEPLRKRALAETQKMTLLLKEQFVASKKEDLARLYRRQQRFDEADRLLHEIIADLQATSPKPAESAFSGPLLELVRLDDDRGRNAEAQQTLAQVFAASTRPTYSLFATRARLHWKQNQRDEALQDLGKALELAEQVRKGGAGGEQERAELYAQFAGLFETMIAWQHELHDAGAAFAVAERFRARSVIDQLEVRGVDLTAGLTPAEAARLRQNETAARINVVTLEKKSAKAGSDKAGVAANDVEAQLSDARQALVESYREIRNASPAYRLAVHADYRPAQLGEIQSRLATSRELLLYYVLGQERGFVIVATPAPEPAVIHELIVTQARADALGIAAGPLTAEKCRGLLNRTARSQHANGRPRGLDLGVGEPDLANDRLSALWEVLIPAEQREALVSGKFAGLVVIPDGVLSLLPFEMLVTGRDKAGAPRYLLDAGPPIRYGPSATVLDNLASRESAAEPKAGSAGVLTVGDPAYSRDPETPADESVVNPFLVAAEFRSAQRRLPRLPASQAESKKLAMAFGDRGLPVTQLLGQVATEERIRSAVSQRHIVHLACHGLVDQAYGNFFGALAVTPGTDDKANPSDDGYLTLSETYELKLRGCKLAVLSACETNYGPHHDGEGVWALSRGFLVAGARRIVASNWLVDDQAGSELIGEFASQLADAYARHRPAGHAAALQAAKRKVREQARWADPYYWAAFVLIGPD